jgi:fibronectin type III domain protein
VRTIRRLAMIALFGVASLVLYAPAVQADSSGSAPAASATTLPATQVTHTSAVLNASIDTRGQPTQWQFQYGQGTDHGHSTPLRQIPAGQGTVNVSATITGLSANTTYRFRVIAMSGIGSHYTEVYYAADRVFTTKQWHGALRLVGKRLHVFRKLVSVRLKCASKLACAGRLSIASAQGSPTVVCAEKSFRIRAGRKRRVRARVSQSCLTLLTNAPHHRLKAEFSSATTTGQRGRRTPVTLILR